MVVETQIPLLEEILSSWQVKIGEDYQGYKNHLYRMIHFCFALHPCEQEEREKIIIAACFHDLGIWSDDTVDYLPPSILLVKAYLEENNLKHWFAEIALMIEMHHKLRQYKGEYSVLVEVFRRADLMDVSLGYVKGGLRKATINEVKAVFPNEGFHKRLMQLTVRQLLRHPLNPLPMMKW